MPLRALRPCRLFRKNRAADGAEGVVVLRHDQRARIPAESGLERLHNPSVRRHSAYETDLGDDLLALGDRALEIARDRIAQAFEDFLGGKTLLLGVDHVALGEHGAAAGNLRGALGGEDDVADLFDLEKQPPRLLIQESARAGGAIAVGLVVGNAKPAIGSMPVKANVLGVLPAHLKQGVHLRKQQLDRFGEGPEFVLLADVELRVQQLRPSACARHFAQRRAIDQRDQFFEQVPGLLQRIPGDTSVAGHGQPAVLARGRGEPSNRLEERVR